MSSAIYPFSQCFKHLKVFIVASDMERVKQLCIACRFKSQTVFVVVLLTNPKNPKSWPKEILKFVCGISKILELVLIENIMCMFRLLKVKNTCVLTNKPMQSLPATLMPCINFLLFIYLNTFVEFQTNAEPHGTTYV